MRGPREFALNSQVGDVGQVGSVFTASAHLKKGIGKAMMKTMMRDLPSLGVSRLILFTGQMDQSAAARALYESLDFERCGTYGLIFSPPR